MRIRYVRVPDRGAQSRRYQQVAGNRSQAEHSPFGNTVRRRYKISTNQIDRVVSRIFHSFCSRVAVLSLAALWIFIGKSCAVCRTKTNAAPSVHVDVGGLPYVRLIRIVVSIYHASGTRILCSNLWQIKKCTRCVIYKTYQVPDVAWYRIPDT